MTGPSTRCPTGASLLNDDSCPPGAVITMGAVAVILFRLFQIAVNIGMVVGLMAATGISLLMSYGG